MLATRFWVRMIGAATLAVVTGCWWTTIGSCFTTLVGTLTIIGSTDTNCCCCWGSHFSNPESSCSISSDGSFSEFRNGDVVESGDACCPSQLYWLRNSSFIIFISFSSFSWYMSAISLINSSSLKTSMVDGNSLQPPPALPIFAFPT
uniref:(northern house mosquito) hypothetical protein n=1 Tax=Culex pipiens TaxID=7175 RepID=A0A8D8AGF8_CULPI